MASLAIDGAYDHYRRSEPPLATPAGNGQLGVANLPDHSVFYGPQDEPAVNPVHVWAFPPQDLAHNGDHAAGLNNINYYNDFVLEDFNRDDFMDILDGIREEEARGFGGGRGDAWNFDA